MKTEEEIKQEIETYKRCSEQMFEMAKKEKRPGEKRNLIEWGNMYYSKVESLEWCLR